VLESAAADRVAPPLRPLPLLRVATDGEEHRLREWYARVAPDVSAAELVGPETIQRLCPLLRPGFGTLALYEPDAMEIDVAAMCETYRQRLLRRGGVVRTGFAVTAVDRSGGSVTIRDRGGWQLSGGLLFIAAGASSGRIGRLAGAVDAKMTITRRTLFLLSTGPGSPPGPRVNVARAAAGRFYFRPEGDGLLCSPADEAIVSSENPVHDEFEVARALDEIESATTIASRHVRRVWAATRSHVADRLPVIGFDPQAPDVFWFTGFFGYGIQANPGLVYLAGGALRGPRLESDFASKAAQSPGRLAAR
jgi:D-arginine dehydrogenase